MLLRELTNPAFSHITLGTSHTYVGTPEPAARVEARQ